MDTLARTNDVRSSAMRECAKYRGRTYYVQSSGRYYQSGRHNEPSERLLHRRVWTDHNGPIPDGHEVHHRDGDWRNNAPENLELAVSGEHQREHMKQRLSDPVAKARNREWLSRAWEASKVWHASPEGIAWHSKHGKETWEAREPQAFKCSECGATFGAYFRRARFCSRACAARVAFRRYFTDPRNCLLCGKAFMGNRHRNTAYCSRACSNRRTK